MTDTAIKSGKSFRSILFRLAGGLAAIAMVGVIWMFLAPVSFWALMTPSYAGDDLSVSQAYEQAAAGTVTLIDIRRPDEWSRTGIGQGAIPLDMRRKDFVEALSKLVAGDLDAPIALICARGVRSAGMSKQLSAAGFTRVIDVPEGMLGSRAGPGWLKSNLPTQAFKEAS